jgi:uncharacterized protein YhaN
MTNSTPTSATPAPSAASSNATGPAQTQNSKSAADAAPVETAETKAAAAKAKLKIKDLELDEDAAYREIQRGRQTSKLLTEAQKRAMAAEQKEAALAAKQGKYKEDLGAFFEDLGVDEETAAQLAADYIYKKQILPQEMSPEQRRVAELEAKLAEYETEKKTVEEMRAEAERNTIVQQESQRLQAELVEAAKAGKIPSTQYGMRKIAAKMLELETRGLSVPLEQVAAAVREESGREFGEIAATAEIADLREWLGEGNFKAMSKKVLDYFLGQMQTSKPAPVVRNATPTQVEKLTPEQFLRKMEGRK